MIMPNIYGCGFKKGSKISQPNVNGILPHSNVANDHSIVQHLRENTRKKGLVRQVDQNFTLLRLLLWLCSKGTFIDLSGGKIILLPRRS